MKRNSKLLRTLSVLAVIALVCLGLALHTGTGTPSAWGIYDIAAICPLGAAEAALASKTVVPPMLIALAIGIALVVLFGRAFCAWGCPIPLLRRIFGLKEPKRKRRASDALDVPAAQRGGAADSRNWVLGGALLSTAVFGFPVFCLICPVGLTFATLIAVWRLFQFNEVALSLLVFPAMLALEVLVLRKWCSRFCPLGALLSLVSRLNRTFRPVSNEATCLRSSKGEHCHQCADVCPEGTRTGRTCSSSGSRAPEPRVFCRQSAFSHPRWRTQHRGDLVARLTRSAFVRKRQGVVQTERRIHAVRLGTVRAVAQHRSGAAVGERCKRVYEGLIDRVLLERVQPCFGIVLRRLLRNSRLRHGELARRTLLRACAQQCAGCQQRHQHCSQRDRLSCKAFAPLRPSIHGVPSVRLFDPSKGNTIEAAELSGTR